MDKKKIIVIVGIVVVILVIVALAFVRCSSEPPKASNSESNANVQTEQNASLRSQHDRGMFANTENAPVSNAENIVSNSVLNLHSESTKNEAATTASNEPAPAKSKTLPPIYVVSHSISYSSDGNVFSDVEKTFDEHGNVTVEHQFVKDTTGIDRDKDFTSTFEGYDANGYCKSTASTTGNNTDIVYEFSNGLATKKTVTPRSQPEAPNPATAFGPTEYQYEYYPSGKLKACRTTGRTGVITTQTYDEDGYEQSTVSEGSNGYRNTTTYKWEKDAFDKITGVTTSYENSGQEPKTEHRRIELDENGNIARVFDDTGLLRAEYSYVLIENPSKAAFAENVKHS